MTTRMFGGIGRSNRNLTPTNVARAALCEVGRPDLAGTVYERYGWPHSSVLAGDRPRAHPDSQLVLRAFRLAHESACHPCEQRALELKFPGSAL